MQEEADRPGKAVGPDLRAERHEVIVVHPDHIVGLQQRAQAAADPLVDAPEGLGEAPVEVREVDAVVEDRPERLIGEAAVEFLDVGRRHVDGGELHAAFRLDLQRTERALLAGLSRPAEPDAAALAQGIANADGEPAGLAGVVQRSDAVRDDKEPVHARPSPLDDRRSSRMPNVPCGPQFQPEAALGEPAKPAVHCLRIGQPEGGASLPGPIFTPKPPSAAAARIPSSSVMSSPTKTGIRPANGGRRMKRRTRRPW